MDLETKKLFRAEGLPLLKQYVGMRKERRGADLRDN